MDEASENNSDHLDVTNEEFDEMVSIRKDMMEQVRNQVIKILLTIDNSPVLQTQYSNLDRTISAQQTHKNVRLDHLSMTTLQIHYLII